MTEKRRGRPPKYDRDTALARAAEVFWRQGLAATSLDDLAGAMKMNRPSLYNAFGDKESVYRQAMALVNQSVAAQLGAALNSDDNLNHALKAFYRQASTIYKGDAGALGCFAICTATVTAPCHESIREDLAGILTQVDEVLKERLEAARPGADYRAPGATGDMARVLQAVLHSLAIRARAGESQAVLEGLYITAVDALFPEP